MVNSYWKDQTFAALNILNDAAKEHDLSMIEISLRWIQHHSALKMRSEGGNDGKRTIHPSIIFSFRTISNPVLIPKRISGTILPNRYHHRCFLSFTTPTESGILCKRSTAVFRRYRM